MRLKKLAALALAAFVPLAGCAEVTGSAAPFRFANMPVLDAAAAPALPRLKWADRPDGPEWTVATMNALGSHGAALPQIVPADIEAWCPGYEDASEIDRRAFWAGLISTLAYYESTHRETAVGGGGKWFGLTQILPSTARGHGCAARTGDALKDGSANLACAVRIMAHTVSRDGVVARGMRGVAADWGPFHSRQKREAMRSWISAQPYCQPRPTVLASVLGGSRPAPRPEDG